MENFQTSSCDRISVVPSRTCDLLEQLRTCLWKTVSTRSSQLLEYPHICWRTWLEVIQYILEGGWGVLRQSAWWYLVDSVCIRSLLQSTFWPSRIIPNTELGPRRMCPDYGRPCSALAVIARVFAGEVSLGERVWRPVRSFHQLLHSCPLRWQRWQMESVSVAFESAPYREAWNLCHEA